MKGRTDQCINVKVILSNAKPDKSQVIDAALIGVVVTGFNLGNGISEMHGYERCIALQ